MKIPSELLPKNTGGYGLLKVELDGGEEGNLWIENGRILHTVVGRLPGIEAFRTIVSSRYVKILSFSG